MVSSNGKPTDPKLREKVKGKVKNEPNKDGSGKGQMAAWKVSRAFATRINSSAGVAPRTRVINAHIGCQDSQGVRKGRRRLRERIRVEERAQKGPAAA